MKDYEKIKWFKSEVRSIPFYSKKIKDLEDRIHGIETSMAGVSSPPMDKITFNTQDPYKDNAVVMMEIKERMEKELNAYRTLSNRVIEDLKCFPDDSRDAIIRIYVGNESYENVSKEYGFSAIGMKKWINRQIEKFVKN